MLHKHTRAHAYACMLARMHTRMHARMHTRMHARTHARTHAHAYTCTHTHIHTYTHAHIHTYELICKDDMCMYDQPIILQAFCYDLMNIVHLLGYSRAG